MALVTFPASARIARADWRLDTPSQVNRSAWTGRRQVFGSPGHARWSASIALAPLVGQNSILAWRSFLVQLRGQINTFRLKAVEARQNTNSGITAAAAASAGARSMTVSTLAQPLFEGQFITANDQLLLITGVSGVGGTTLAFEPALRADLGLGTAVEVANPTAHVALVDSGFGWSVDRGQVYTVGFDVEEVF